MVNEKSSNQPTVAVTASRSNSVFFCGVQNAVVVVTFLVDLEMLVVIFKAGKKCCNTVDLFFYIQWLA